MRSSTDAAGRADPTGPYGSDEYLVDMDRYCGFVYHALLADLMNSPRLQHNGSASNGGRG